MTRGARSTLSVLLLAGLPLVGCSTSVPTAASPVAAQGAQPATQFPTLRVTNTGFRSIEGLVVVFPDERVVFGDVSPGATTTYQTFSKGVFRYAAYEHRVGARTINQPVIDWVGELPMPGEAFTYSIAAFDLPRVGMTIVLVSTSRDR